jgi:hypothetical protein
MSNNFFKNELGTIFNNMTETEMSLPKWITVVDKANNQDNATSSAFVQQGGNFSATSANSSNAQDNATSSAFVQQGGNFSATSANSSNAQDNATSSAFVQQGGNFSATSANSSNAQDINKLMSMLTSDTILSDNALSQTSTESLEVQLRTILNQDGGSKNKKISKQNGGNGNGNDININDIKSFFMNLKAGGVDVKLDNQTMSEFFGGGPTSDDKAKSDKASGTYDTYDTYDASDASDTSDASDKASDTASDTASAKAHHTSNTSDGNISGIYGGSLKGAAKAKAKKA